jgi:subtilisin-like proprotein convertase family protein
VGTITGTSTDTPVAIPDNDPTGGSSTISISDNAPIAGIAVDIYITHTYRNDLKMYLSDGTTEVLFNLGTVANNSNGDEHYYYEEVTDFNGGSSAGPWTLRIEDNAGQDVGTLDSWTITFTTPDDYGMAIVPVTAAGVGKESQLGAGAPTLALVVSGVGLQPAKGAVFVPITAAGQGGVEVVGDGAVTLSVAAAGRAAVDWVSQLDPIQLQEVYRLIITGSADSLDDLVLGGISSWQATNQAGDRSSYLQAVIPAASEFLNAIEARKNGDLIIEKGFVLADGTERYEEILRSNFDAFRYDRGPGSLTVTVSGYLSGKPSANATRPLTGVRTISMNDGKYRVRCAIDLFLQPGMTVTGEVLVFTADYINYYVSETDKFCEVSER